MSGKGGAPPAMLVTGAGAGIGLATALAGGARGWSLALLDRDAAALSDVAERATRAGAPAVVVLAGDVADEPFVAGAVAAAADRLGPLTALVTSAGIDRGGLVHELPLARWQEVISTNLTGTFLCCKHMLAHMVAHARGGALVCLSSPWAEVSAPGGASAYCASKGGVSALVRSMALDYARHGIRVNAVLPGATETALMWAGQDAAQVPQLRNRVAAQLAMGRLARPEEIASAILWLLGPESSYATGSQLVVDGGLLARGSIEC